jgi:MFS family permease
MKADTGAPSPSAFAPFGISAFAVLWSATVMSNIGTWMMMTGSAWLMTSLAPSPIMVSAVQAASSAPIFLFALFAGALSDLFDRRRLLLVCQILTACSAVGFAALVALDLVSAALLLVFTFVMATGAAFVAPSWQAIVPQLVPRAMLGQAIALNSMGINVARAIGPALAGLLIVTLGMAAPFIADAASFLFIIAALLWWRTAPRVATVSSREHIPAAIVGGLRYAANSAEMKAAMGRAAGFFVFGSAPMSLLPIIARTRLGGDASAYGLLMAAVGVGAVAGASVLPRFKGTSPSRRVVAGTVLTSVGGVALALAESLALGMAASALFGLGWIMVLATLNTAAQLALPDWVRARGLALFTMVFSGAMMVGSLAWGATAQSFGTPFALFVAAAGGLLTAALLARLKLADGSLDLTPSAHWPEPAVTSAADDEHGPVMVSVEYRIKPAERLAMMTALGALKAARRRGGATYWAAFEDVAVPGRILEMFIEQSWRAHLRHHGRVSQADRALQELVIAFHTGAEPPRVTHWLTPDTG